MKYINYYNIGYDNIQHKGKNTVSTVTSKKYQSYIESLDSFPYDTGVVPPGYEHRPDLISDLFYGTSKLDWLILLFNNIDDPFQNLNIGDVIRIPKIQ